MLFKIFEVRGRLPTWHRKFVCDRGGGPDAESAVGAVWDELGGEHGQAAPVVDWGKDGGVTILGHG